MKQNLFNMTAILFVVAVTLLGCKSLTNKLPVSSNSIYSQRADLMKLEATGNPTNDKAKLKGKIAIAITEVGGSSVLPTELHRFSSISGTFFAEENPSFLFSADVFAKNLDELETLIQIFASDVGGSVKIIDYKTKTLIAKVEYERKNNPEQIQDNALYYVANLPNDFPPQTSPTPSGESFSYLDFTKMPLETKQKFENKFITISGYGKISYAHTSENPDRPESVFIKDNTVDDLNFMSNSFECKVTPISAAAFGKLARDKFYKFTLVTQYISGKGQVCQLVKAVEVPKNKSYEELEKIGK